MYLSVRFMSNVIGALGIIMYIAAPFFADSKKALIYRILGELLLGLMFFYIGCLAGVGYYIALAISILLEKQIEKNKIVSLCFGIVSCVAVMVINNNGIAGRILALSLLLIYFPIDENKMLTTSSFIDVITAVILLYYSINVKSISSIIFALILFIIAIAGLFSSIRLAKAGGLQAAAAEEQLYQINNNNKNNKKKKNSSR